MSRDYYFHKWRNILDELDKLIEFDLFLQTSKCKEEQLCLAAFWLTSMLARYMIVYTDICTCLINNLQVQKTQYYEVVAKSVENRISELKTQLTKLESSPNRFFSSSLICHRLTPFDIEPRDYRVKTIESIKLSEKLKNVAESVRKKREEEELAKQAEEEEAAAEAEAKASLWKDKRKKSFAETYEVIKKMSETELERRRLVSLIQAQERSRQVIKQITQSKQKRELWEKELTGSLHPPAPLQTRERAAKLIQLVARKYFELKRKKILDYKRDEMLGLQFYAVQKPREQSCSNDPRLRKHLELKTMYIAERDLTYDNFRTRYIERKADILRDDHREFLRNWFLKWYREANVFFDIPKEKQGGSTLILKEEVMEPYQWVEEYEAYIEKKNKNKNKTEYQKKAEVQAKKKEKLLQQKLKKISKNRRAVDLAGYDFPKSKIVPEIQKAINLYHDMWDEYDRNKTFDVKQKFVADIEFIKAITEFKEKICYEVDVKMQEELKLLKETLKADYENNEKEMPQMEKAKKRTKKTRKKHKRLQAIVEEDNITIQLEEMMEKGYLRDYPKTYFEEFEGDHNFIGDDIRCLNRLAQPYAGELRNIWWERCREAANKFQRILLVGPNSSGRTTLAYILATANDAAYYEFSPLEIQKSSLFSAPYLEHLVNMTTACVRKTQPAVIFIRHIEHLFLKKPRQELKETGTLMVSYFVKKLCKFNKTDRVTIIASCSHPWETKMSQIQKCFLISYITPDTSYAVTSKMLRDWVANNRVVPPDFCISALANILKGYEYNFLKNTLNRYLSGERLTRISYRGLDPSEVYNFVVEMADKFAADNVEYNNELPLTNYEKYWEYYIQKTAWGKKELKRQKEQVTITEKRRVLAEKEENKRKLAEKKIISNVSSVNTIHD